MTLSRTTLIPFLDDLERRINAEEERTLLDQWMDFYGGKTKTDIFIAERKNRYPARVIWPKIVINEAIKSDGFDAMILRELKSVSDILEAGTDDIPCVRSNYGTGILPSVFGAGIFYLDDSADTLPTAVPLGGRDKIKAIIDRGISCERAGLMQKTFKCAEYYLELTKSYPKIRKHIPWQRSELHFQKHHRKGPTHNRIPLRRRPARAKKRTHI